MTKKQQHVPETNGHRRQAEPRAAAASGADATHVEDANLSRDTGDDLQDQDVPASTKATADKWNQ